MPQIMTRENKKSNKIRLFGLFLCGNISRYQNQNKDSSNS
nr:MAG TPA: hypothetical protein [Caudoviricetes sp.]